MTTSASARCFRHSRKRTMATPMTISGRLAESDRSRQATMYCPSPARGVEQRLVEREDELAGDEPGHDGEPAEPDGREEWPRPARRGVVGGPVSDRHGWRPALRRVCRALDPCVGSLGSHREGPSLKASLTRGPYAARPPLGASATAPVIAAKRQLRRRRIVKRHRQTDRPAECCSSAPGIRRRDGPGTRTTGDRQGGFSSSSHVGFGHENRSRRLRRRGSGQCAGGSACGHWGSRRRSLDIVSPSASSS